MSERNHEIDVEIHTYIFQIKGMHDYHGILPFEGFYWITIVHKNKLCTFVTICCNLSLHDITGPFHGILTCYQDSFLEQQNKQ